MLPDRLAVSERRPREEAVPGSAGFGAQNSVSPTRGEQSEPLQVQDGGAGWRQLLSLQTL